MNTEREASLQRQTYVINTLIRFSEVTEHLLCARYMYYMVPVHVEFGFQYQPDHLLTESHLSQGLFSHSENERLTRGSQRLLKISKFFNVVTLLNEIFLLILLPFHS